MALTGTTNEEKIWNYLKAQGMTDAGTAGLMGNLYAESGLRPNNLQNSYEGKLGMADAEYTELVDKGSYTNFVRDSAGYGLCQWTYWSRKEALLAYAKAAGKSIGDLEMQLGFLMKELSSGYKAVLAVLKTATTVRAASDAVLLQFERPADQSETAKARRAGFGQKYFAKYAAKEGQSVSFVPRMTRPEAGNKYYITKAAGGYSDAVKGSPTDTACNVLSNCVGYAYGRFNEIIGEGACKHLRPVNAENFIQYKGALEVGQEPRLGACMVWQKGATLKGTDGAGHVAIVEKIISKTEIVTSESGWKASKPFWTQTRKKGSGNWGQGSGYKFLGFIYNPAPCCKGGVATTGGDTAGDTTQNKPTPVSGLKVGDTVDFTGTTHYASSNSTSAVACKPGRAKVTAISAGAKHPYHLVRVSGGKSTLYGWVNTADIVGTSSVADVAVYTVAAGDSLWGIAQKRLGNGNRYKEIMTLNGLTSTTIHPGQKLRLPS